MAPSLFGILWRTTWTRLISLCIYISTAIYQNAESTNRDISSVWQQREMWICEGHNSRAVPESLYANTLSHGHGQTSATVDIRQRETTTWEQIYLCINICIVPVLIYCICIHGYLGGSLFLYIYCTSTLHISTVYLLYIYCISTVYLSCIYWWHRGYPARLPLLTVPRRHIMW